MPFTLGVLFFCSIVELYYGAVQLGLLNSPIASSSAYVVMLVFSTVITFVFAIFVGDYVVLKCTGYRHGFYGRWSMHTGGGGDGFESAPGRWLYVLAVFALESPIVYFTLLFFRS